jgi:hypothetical protein
MRTFSGIIALAYVAVVITDPLLTLVAAINAAGQIVVLSFALKSRADERKSRRRKK